RSSDLVGRNLRAGQRVPSSRALAVELRISRIPVLGAYSQLLAEGYFEARSGSGTFVSSSLPDQRLSLDRGNHIAQAFRPGRRLVSRRSALLPSYKPAPWTNKWGAFIVGQLAFEHFPFQDRKSTRLNSSHVAISYAVFCLKKKKNIDNK